MRPLFRLAGMATALASASALACGGGPPIPDGPLGMLFVLILFAVMVAVPVGLLAAAVTVLVAIGRAVTRAVENAQDRKAKHVYVSRTWRRERAGAPETIRATRRLTVDSAERG